MVFETSFAALDGTQITIITQSGYALSMLCLNRTNGKENRVRLRTSSQTIGEDSSKPNLNPNPNPNVKPKPKPNPKKKKLRKET